MDRLHQNYLEHHGILGQKWGRKQGPPYPLDAEDHSAKEKKEGYKKSIGGGKNKNLYDRLKEKHAKSKERRSYDYKTSERYKKGSNRTKAGLRRAYETDKSLYGKRAANRIQYDVNVKGMKRQTAVRRELTKKVVTSAIVYSGIVYGPAIFDNITQKIAAGRSHVYQNNVIMNAYVDQVGGLNEVKGGFTPGFKYAERGKKAVEAMLKAGR